jgi:hypothetical protein
MDVFGVRQGQIERAVSFLDGATRMDAYAGLDIRYFFQEMELFWHVPGTERSER